MPTCVFQSKCVFESVQKNDQVQQVQFSKLPHLMSDRFFGTIPSGV